MPLCVCGYCLLVSTFEGFGMTFVSVWTRFALAAMKRYCALTYLGVITATLGLEAPGTLFHFCAFLIKLKISNNIVCLTTRQVRCHQLYVFSVACSSLALLEYTPSVAIVVCST